MATNAALPLGTQDEAAETHAAVSRFNDAFARHDVDGIMAAMTDDCLFAAPPPPDGQRYAGQAAVRAYWVQFFQNTPEAHFDEEDCFVAGDRCVVQWRYSWARDGAGHVRGVDVFRVREGKIAEKLAYVK